MLLPEYEMAEEYHIDKAKIITAYSEMRELRTKTYELYKKVEQLLSDSTEVVKCQTGIALTDYEKVDCLEPIDNLCVVMDHIYDLLTTIVGKGYYNKVLSGYVELNDSITVADADKEGIAIKK